MLLYCALPSEQHRAAFCSLSIVSDGKDNSWCHANHTSHSALSKTGGCDMADMCDVSKAQGVLLLQHVDQPDS